jgi:hypothetical protein
MDERTLWEGWLPASGLDETKARVERIAKRAVKKGFPAPTLTVLATERRRRTTDANPEDMTTSFSPASYEEWVRVRVTAFGPLALGGWTLIGVVDELPNGASFLRRLPGTDAVAPEGFILDPKRCDHCHESRNRLETFLVFDGTDWRLVGRNCLADFLGHNPANLIAYARDLGSLSSDEGYSGFGGGRREFKMDDLVYLASRVVAVTGFYVGRAKAEIEHRSSTRDEVSRFYSKEAKKAENEYPESDAAKAIYDATVVALNDIPHKETTSDWEESLGDLWESEYVLPQHLGYAVSAVCLGMRHQERVAREKVAAEKAPSKHLGKVGDKIAVDAKVEFVRFFENNWGGAWLVKFRTDDADLTWWASNLPYKVERTDTTEPVNYEPGDAVKLTGTIKAHDIDKFTTQPVTVLTRCKLSLAA